MNPDIVDAIPRLVEGGILPPGPSRTFLRAARRGLVSVHLELRFLLYLGVLLITGGVGLLVKENLERIGPVVIAVAIGLAAAGCLVWVWRKAPPFSWGPVRSPHPGLDYILLLGVLLAAADLAYVEVQFTPLGDAWAWHLLIVALAAGLAAVRFDSRVVFSLALTSFAAWRGVSASGFSWLQAEEAVRWNAIGCGVLFVLLGFVAKKLDRKAHFEPVAVHTGWLLILGGLVAGLAGGDWAGYTLALVALGAGLAAGAYRFRRFPLFAFGVLAAYTGLSRFVVEAGEEVLGCFWFFATSLAVIAGLVVVQRRLKEPL